MFRWIWGSGNNDEGKKEVKEAEKPVVRVAPEEKGRVRWVLHEQGFYVKDTKSTTAALMTAVATTPQTSPLVVRVNQSASNQQESSLVTSRIPPRSEIPSRMDADIPSLPSESDPVLLDTSEDALGAYQEQLRKHAAALQGVLEKWKLEKEKIIGDDLDLQRYANVKRITANYSVMHGIRAFFENLFTSLKDDLEPASDELHGLLDKAHGAVQALCLELEDLSKALNDSSKSAHERHKICIDMCNVGMEIAEDMIKLVDNIRAELEYCLRFEKISEKAAVQLIELAILIVTKIPVPEMDFNFSSSYRNFLYNEIQQEKKAIDRFETDVLGALRRAMAIIVTQEKKWEMEKTVSSRDPSPSPDPALGSSMEGVARLFSQPSSSDTRSLPENTTDTSERQLRASF